MENEKYREVLEERESELQEELNLIRKLLGKNPQMRRTIPPKKEQQPDMFPVIVESRSKSTLGKVRNAISKLLEHEISLQVDDIRANLDKMGVEYNKSSVHNALKALREKGELISYKINNSNHMVFYMNPDGRDDSLDKFPVKKNYRPKGISESEIEEFEFKEE